jgi:hypothetical protein
MRFGRFIDIHDLRRSRKALRRLLATPSGKLELAATRLLDLLVTAGCCTVIEEREYIDSDFRAGHTQFYYLHHRETPRVCTRLHYFATEVNPSTLNQITDQLRKAYLGFSVIRPLPTNRLGRTILHEQLVKRIYPDFLLSQERYLTCISQYLVNLAGNEISFWGTPWIQQDKLVSACASAAIWTANWHLANRFPTDFRRYSTTQINDLAFRPYLSTLRAFPSEGLSAEQMFMAMTSMGYHPLLKRTISALEARRTAHHYLTSSIPVIAIVTIPNSSYPTISSIGHALTFVGYTLDMHTDPLSEIIVESSKPRRIVSGSEFVARFIVQDDSGGPLRFAEFLEWDDAFAEGEIDSNARDILKERFICLVRLDSESGRKEIAYLYGLIIPLPLRVSLEDSRAHQNAIEVIRSVIEKDRPGCDLVVNTFLVPSNQYKKWWVSNGIRDVNLSRRIRQQTFPSWVWVTEFANREIWKNKHSHSVLGHVVQDCAGRGSEVLSDDLLLFFSTDRLVVLQPNNRFALITRNSARKYIPSLSRAANQIKL